MKRRTVFWQFFGVHTLILVIAVGFVAGYTWRASRQAYYRQWVRELELQARLAAALLPRLDGSVDEQAIARFGARTSGLGAHRFTLILPDGRVLSDSEADAEQLGPHDNRPEVRDALASGIGVSERHSSTLNQRMLYVAKRVQSPEGDVQAVVRVSAPVRALTREWRATHRMLVVLLAVVLGSTLAVSYLAARRIVGPVSELQDGLARIGEGDLGFRLRIPPVPHLAGLARSINGTADRLQKYISALNEERNLRTLMLQNMTRGVIAIDARHAIMDLNDSACQLLNVRRPAAEGTRIGEIARYPALLELIDASEAGSDPVEGEMTAGPLGDTLVHLRATALKDVSGARIGTLMVLSDVTMLRRLETVRQDFVANVSHELRTPVTSVKGFAETLLDGALRDPATAERFVRIIARQASQLESIICDLLELSRLEQSSTAQIERRMTPLAGTLKNAIELCQNRSAERQATIHLECEEGLEVLAHPGLIEQAVVNLLDNAVKYGRNGGPPRVEVTAKRVGREVVIAVRDYGPGIDRRHFPRLFERFYRVDRGRSRELGGTGLGLAIVKHIALIHQGSVSVESEIGAGATFKIHLSAEGAPGAKHRPA